MYKIPKNKKDGRKNTPNPIITFITKIAVVFISIVLAGLIVLKVYLMKTAMAVADSCSHGFYLLITIVKNSSWKILLKRVDME